MAIDFKELMSKKSDDGLTDYLTNFNKYTPEAIAAAVEELKSRGRNFSNDELNDIQGKIQARSEAKKEEDSIWSSASAKRNIVTDENAPLLYSQGAIRGFSILFTVVFGAALLASNLNDRKKKWAVIGFGVVYTTIAIIILNQIPRSTAWTLGLNAGGGFGLTAIFWDRYIGKDTKYRAKPIWKPLIISIIITALFLIALIYGDNAGV